MSKKKTVILGLLVLVLLAAAVIGVSVMNRVKEANAPEESSSSIVLKNLWENSREDMKSIDLKTQTDLITLVPNGYNKTGTMLWVIEGHEDWHLINTYQNIVTMAALLPAYKLIEEDVTDPDRLDDFGLKDPTSVLTVNFKDGTSKTCYVGILSSDKEYTFCRIEGDNNVYATNSEYAKFASFTRNSIRLTTMAEIDNSGKGTLMYVFVQKKGETPVEIKKDESIVLTERPVDGAIYRTTDNVFVQPYTNPYIQVGTDLEYNYLQYLTTPEVVETVDADCQDFEQYGLGEEPEYHEKLITRTGDSEDNYEYNTTDYYFGYTYGDSNQYIYFREAGSSMVLGVDASEAMLTEAYEKAMGLENPPYFIRQRMQDSGKEPDALNELLKRLKAMIRWAYAQDLIPDTRCVDKLSKFKAPPHRISIQDKYLDSAELKKVVDQMSVQQWKLLTQFLALSGLRFSEFCALEKRDVDLDQHVIHVNKGYDSNNIFT